MAVYRQVQISYWQDKFVLKLTPEEKFFYLYLLTNSKTKQCGIYELPIDIICLETGYNRETVLKLVQRFIEHKKIAYDWENEEVFLHNWVKHNPFDGNKNITKCIIRELEDVHNKEMIPLTSPLQALMKPIHNKKKKKNKNNNKNNVTVTQDNVTVTKGNSTGGGDFLVVDSGDIDKLFLVYMSKQPDLYDRTTTENLVNEYGWEKVKDAFQKTRDRLSKPHIGYVKGVLAGKYDKRKQEKEEKSKPASHRYLND